MAEMLENMLELEADTQRGKYLTFCLGKEVYGIEIRYVTEIVGLQSIVEMPEMPQYVKGIINLRGKIIPVIDMRIRLKKAVRGYDDRTCIIVVEIDGGLVGLIVDNVDEVLSVGEQEIVPPPQISNNYHNRYLKGIGKVGNSVRLLIDCHLLVNGSELVGLEDIA